VLGAENVCRAAEALHIEDIVFTSSVAVYGIPQGEPDEETQPNPFNLYGKTKWEAEGVYRAWQQGDAATRRLDMVRPTVVFGPGNRGNVYNLLAQLARPHFVMVGRGKNRKSMAYVRNVAAYLAHLIEAEHKAGTTLCNYCDAPAYNMNELLREVRTALGKPVEPDLRIPYALGIAIGSLFDLGARLTGRSFAISKVRVQKFCANTVFSTKRLESGDFKPPYDLRTALHETIAREFPAAPAA
jgi:nucleoside-diphosphate-sugar epimerase